MKRLLIALAVIVAASVSLAQTYRPGTCHFTANGAGFVCNSGATLTIDSGATLVMNGTNSGGTYTLVNIAGGSANPWDYTGTLGIMNGSDTFQVFDVNITNADHTGAANVVEVLNVANITGDAHATETALNIGTGWDYGLLTGSLISGSLGLDVTGAAVNLNASSNYAVNVATGTSTGAVTIGSTTSAQAITIQSGTGDVTVTSTDDASITVTDDLTINGGSAGSVLNFGTNTHGNVIHIGDNDTTADTITIGSAKDTSSLAGIAVTVGSTGTTSALTLQSGTGDVTITSTDDLIATITDDILLAATTGAEAGTGVTAVNKCLGGICQTVITLTAAEVTITDPAGAAAYGGLKIYDFPAGWIYRIGVVADLAITAGAGGIADNFDGDVALGGTVSGGGGMAGDEVAWVASTATPQAAAGVTTADCQSTATEHTIGDGHTTALDLYLNFEVDDADISSSDTLSVTGTITVTWITLGDN